jgi:threonine aldolase
MQAATADTHVYAVGDGIPFSPSEYAALLAKVTASGDVEPDDYSRGGAVEKLEHRMAAALGKEAAVWLPTGTLANHLAVRILARDRRRVLVQAESHLYRDCGDCCQTLSGLTLVPLAEGRATFGPDEVEAASADAVLGRVATAVGAIQIETPVRRKSGERFDFDAMKSISSWARERRVGMHLDGARLFIESACTGRPVSDYTALFDTVYVSLYKYFNAASGAILAGPRPLLQDLYHTRRMFGAGLPQVWPYAVVALQFIEGFPTRFRQAMDASGQVIRTLSNDSNFEFERIPNETNIFRVRVRNVNAPVYNMRLEQAGISARTPSGDWFSFQVNETWNRIPPAEIVSRLRTALG